MIHLLFDGSAPVHEILAKAQEKIANAITPAWEKEHWQNVVEWLSDQEKITVQSSGSTGAPKQIQLTKRAVRKSAELTQAYFNLPPRATAWLVLPAVYIAGKMMVIRALVNGWKLYASEPHQALPEADRDFDFAALTPAQMESVLSHSFSARNHLKTVILGGGVISESLIERLQQIEPRVAGTYGMAETITHVAIRELNGPGKQSVFHALPGVSFERDARGCLVICAAHLDEKNIITNDVVELPNAFSFRFIARADNVIVSGGVKLYPEEIEAAVAHLVPSPFYLSGADDEVLGRRLVLILEGKEYDTDALLKRWKEQEGGIKTPKEVRFVECFERTESGKIKRHKN